VDLPVSAPFRLRYDMSNPVLEAAHASVLARKPTVKPTKRAVFSATLELRFML